MHKQQLFLDAERRVAASYDREALARHKPPPLAIPAAAAERRPSIFLSERSPQSTDSWEAPLRFTAAEPLPPRGPALRQAERTLRLFADTIRDDYVGLSTLQVLPQKFFYADARAGHAVKLKVVNVGPDTPALSLPAYTLRLIKLVRHRRRRLAEIREGHALFAHENKGILEHEIQLFEQALKEALTVIKMVGRSSAAKRKPDAAPPQRARRKADAAPSLGLDNRPLRPPATAAVLKPRPSLNQFIDNLSLDGVTDLLSDGGLSSQSTTGLEEEVEALRTNLLRVREDIALIVNGLQEDAPPITHIRACSTSTFG